jgi:glycerol kinase
MTAALRRDGHEPMVQQKTGLLLDPYFSGSKLAWLLDNVEGARARAEAGKLAFGTIDSWLIWKLTGGKRHVTDATNAARTLLYNIREGRWDDDILKLLNIPEACCPRCWIQRRGFRQTPTPRCSATPIPILGVAGDQQAATLGQACFTPGMLKSTYGTGCFALLNTGRHAGRKPNRLLGTIAYQFDGKPTYALEGSIFIAGAVVQWLRDGLKIIKTAPQSQGSRKRRTRHRALPRARLHRPRRALLGPRLPRRDLRSDPQLRPGGDRAAALESVGYQTRDLWEAMAADWDGAGGNVLRVDGGMTASDWTMQFLADILGAPVDRPKVLETTALGAAWVAGMQAGVYPGFDDFAEGLGAGTDLHAADGRGHARGALCRVERCRLPHAEQPWLSARPTPARRARADVLGRHA